MDKRSKIIHSTIELIAEHGFHGAPMSLVAKRADVAAGTIYGYFESKDDLIRETHIFLEQQILTVLVTDYPIDESVRDRFLHIGRKLVKYFIDLPMEFRFMEQFINSPYGVAHRRQMLFGNREQNIVVKLFKEAIELKVVKELPLPILFALTIGPLLDVCRDHALDFIFLDEPLIEQTIAACWDGVKR
jgi:AcrR family transcriptional regulator